MDTREWTLTGEVDGVHSGVRLQFLTYQRSPRRSETLPCMHGHVVSATRQRHCGNTNSSRPTGEVPLSGVDADPTPPEHLLGGFRRHRHSLLVRTSNATWVGARNG